MSGAKVRKLLIAEAKERQKAGQSKGGVEKAKRSREMVVTKNGNKQTEADDVASKPKRKPPKSIGEDSMAVEPGRGPASWFGPDEIDGLRMCVVCRSSESAEPIAPTKWRRGNMTVIPFVDALPSQYVCRDCRVKRGLLYHEMMGWILDPGRV